MKQCNVTTKKGGKFLLETTKAVEYDEKGLLDLRSRLLSDLHECQRQKLRLDEWEQETQEQLAKIDAVLIESRLS